MARYARAILLVMVLAVLATVGVPSALAADCPGSCPSPGPGFGVHVASMAPGGEGFGTMVGHMASGK